MSLVEIGVIFYYFETSCGLIFLDDKFSCGTGPVNERGIFKRYFYFSNVPCSTSLIDALLVVLLPGPGDDEVGGAISNDISWLATHASDCRSCGKWDSPDPPIFNSE